MSAIHVACKSHFDVIQNLGAARILCSAKSAMLPADLLRISISTTGTGEVSQVPIKLAYINSSLQTGSCSLIGHAC
ncbi:hypothetical protein EDD22DRAFT_774704 [Suillus occidentalis]|nr:hypothetical protein EDD22DRAFT_774704 [Suillus occidentalis]